MCIDACAHCKMQMWRCDLPFSHARTVTQSFRSANHVQMPVSWLQILFLIIDTFIFFVFVRVQFIYTLAV